MGSGLGECIARRRVRYGSQYVYILRMSREPYGAQVCCELTAAIVFFRTLRDQLYFEALEIIVGWAFKGRVPRPDCGGVVLGGGRVLLAWLWPSPQAGLPLLQRG